MTDERRVAAAVHEALERIRRQVPASPWTPVRFTVVSSLAAGADQLVAREILHEEDALLETPLPMPREKYLAHFESRESRQAFEALLRHASLVVELPRVESAEDAYARVGRCVVDSSDVILAVWDGLPARGRGGTGEIIEYARAKHTPLVWISTEEGHAVVDRDLDRLGGSFEQLDRFNRQTISKTRSRNALDEQQKLLLSDGAAATLGEDAAREFFDWVIPHAVRADVLALRFQALVYRLNDVLYGAVTLAVLVISLQAVFRWSVEVVWIEVALLSLAVGIVVGGRTLSLHRRWLWYRFLAERFRAAFFLAAAGLGRHRQGEAHRDVSVSEQDEDWLRLAYTEVWNQRPRPREKLDVATVRDLLGELWIADQIRYYERSGKRHERRYRVFVRTIYVVLLITIAAALLHIFMRSWHEDVRGHLLTVLSITLPALGAALAGVAAQREHQRHAARYRAIANALSAVRDRMRTARDLAAVRLLADEAERIMLEESRDWLGVMRFHDFEVHV